MLKRIIVLIGIIGIFSSLYCQAGYRGILWGSSAEAVKKTAIKYHSNQYTELDNAVVFNGTFQGNDAVYKYIFDSDSLILVGVTSLLEFNLSDKEKYAKAFRHVCFLPSPLFLQS